MLETILHYYRFDITKKAQDIEYNALCERLRALGLKKFHSICSSHSEFYGKHIQPLNGKRISLETKHLFGNQWNTAPTETSESGIRVFDWAEPIFKNKNLKIGMWLEQTDEMRTIRAHTLKCGYCGAYYSDESGKMFCDKCLDSPYLKSEELHLLRLLPVSKEWGAKRAPLSVDERAALMPVYVERQTVSMNSRAVAAREAKIACIKEHAENAIYSATTERDGMLWLLERHINTENCIYYTHTNMFSFGWRSTLSDDVKKELTDKLADFPYKWEFK